MKTSRFLLIFLLGLMTEITLCDKNGSEVVTVTEKEGRDVILPCSLRTKTSVESKIFDWRKDAQKEVFRYDAGLHDNNGLGGQNKQFRGRVSYFQEELKNGNASIIIRSITTADRGVYTCDFPRLQPRQKFYIKLIVDAVLKPYVTILSETKDGVQLQCEVVGTYPGIKLKIGWQDGSGNNLTEKEIQKTERGESYILSYTVTKSGYYRCVATQEEIKHQVYTETYVPVHVAEESKTTLSGVVGFLIGLGVGLGLGLGVGFTIFFYRKHSNTGSEETQNKNDQSLIKEPPEVT